MFNSRKKRELEELVSFRQKQDQEEADRQERFQQNQEKVRLAITSAQARGNRFVFIEHRYPSDWMLFVQAVTVIANEMQFESLSLTTESSGGNGSTYCSGAVVITLSRHTLL